MHQLFGVYVCAKHAHKFPREQLTERCILCAPCFIVKCRLVCVRMCVNYISYKISINYTRSAVTLPTSKMYEHVC